MQSWFWPSIGNAKIVVLSYWDFVNQETVGQIYPPASEAGQSNMAECLKPHCCWRSTPSSFSWTVQSITHQRPSHPMMSVP